jgi:hypothetical protein
MTGQAWAVVYQPAYLILPATNSTGNYGVSIKKSYTPGASYILEESPNGVDTWTAYDNGTSTYKVFTGKAGGNYFYRAKAYLGAEESGYTAVRQIAVNSLTAVMPPPFIILAATNSTGSYGVSIQKSTTAGAGYSLEESKDGGPWVATDLLTANYRSVTGQASGTYAYRARAYVGANFSSYTAPRSIVVSVSGGVAACESCHLSGPGPATFGPWNSGRHANVNNYPVDGCSSSCHSPLNEVNASGADMISCEGCHGLNNGHNFAASDAVPVCANCHNSHMSAVGNIVTKVNSGKHAIAANTHNGTCGRCHSIEGYLAFGNGTENYGEISATAYDGASSVSCAACHDSHSLTLRTPRDWNLGSAQFNLCTSCHNLVNAAGTPIASGLEVNGVTTVAKQQHSKDWYRNITTTHMDLTTTGVTGSASTVQPLGNIVEGYVVRKDSDTACTDCHGHELFTNTNGVSGATPSADTNHTDWAKSAHAGELLKAKIGVFAANAYARTTTTSQAIMAVGAVDAPIGNAWTHYNWDATSTRGSCQHCHTATGASNYMMAASKGAAYNAANNDFSHLAGWDATNGSDQQELLYCWGCHSSVETGALLLTGAFTLDYQVNGAAKKLTAPDGNSAACLTCHSGRGNVDTLLGANPLDPANTTVISSPGTKTHYLAAGMSLNQAAVKAPYTFGLSYADPVYYGHDSLGCAECHMTSGNKHSFNVVKKDATTGLITAIASTKCVECHDGEHALFVSDSQVGQTLNIWDGVSAAVPTVVTQQMADNSALVLEEEALGYHEAIQILGGLLTKAGTPPKTSYPYFSGTPANQGQSGSMYNYSFLHHEPGAYAHNRFMAKRMLFDSIDWMDNGVLDGTIPFDGTLTTWLYDDTGAVTGTALVDLTNYPEAAAWFGLTAPGSAVRP